jgi:hypothetical protein
VITFIIPIICDHKNDLHFAAAIRNTQNCANLHRSPLYSLHPKMSKHNIISN